MGKIKDWLLEIEEIEAAYIHGTIDRTKAEAELKRLGAPRERLTEMDRNKIEWIYMLYGERSIYRNMAHDQLVYLGVQSDEAEARLREIDEDIRGYLHGRTGYP